MYDGLMVVNTDLENDLVDGHKHRFDVTSRHIIWISSSQVLMTLS